MSFSKATPAIRVAIVDDSPTMRAMLSQFLGAEKDIEVVGTAPDPYAAREMIKRTNPDVITLDVEMPKMNGLEFLEKIMTLRPMPVIMASSLTTRGADITLKALETGAVDCVAKPSSDQECDIAYFRFDLVHKVRAAAHSRARMREAPSADTPLPAFQGDAAQWLIAIGASTGGVEALAGILPKLPKNMPPLVITQHMPPMFTASLAKRLDGQCAMQVQEAADNTPITPGHIYIAPGGMHLSIEQHGNKLRCHVFDGEAVSGHKPSVDVLFDSVARLARLQRVGVILTGMGHDGAKGLLSMRESGATTFGQSAESCVVYGMPRSAVQMGAVEHEFPLSVIAAEILKHCNRRQHP